MKEKRHKIYSLPKTREAQALNYAQKAVEALNHYDPDNKYTIRTAKGSKGGVDYTKAEVVRAGAINSKIGKPIFSYTVDMNGESSHNMSEHFKNLKKLHSNLVNKKKK